MSGSRDASFLVEFTGSGFVEGLVRTLEAARQGPGSGVRVILSLHQEHVEAPVDHGEDHVVDRHGERGVLGRLVSLGRSVSLPHHEVTVASSCQTDEYECRVIVSETNTDEWTGPRMLPTNLNCLPCIDSDDRAATARRMLDVDREFARELGRSAVDAIAAGQYEAPSGRLVDWSEQVARCPVAQAQHSARRSGQP